MDKTLKPHFNLLHKRQYKGKPFQSQMKRVFDAFKRQPSIKNE